MSDDHALMISGETYTDLAAAAMTQAAAGFGGPAFHSCGNWAGHLPAVMRLPQLRMVDGAFSAATDPAPNDCAPFAEALAGSGIVLNARVVGNADLVADKVRQLWRPGLKLIVVTYCQNPEEQARAYDRVHEICGT